MADVKFEGTFDGQQVKPNGIVFMNFKAPHSSLPKAIKTIVSIGKGIDVSVADKAGEVVAVGAALFHRIAVDRDGEAKLTLSLDLSDVQVTSSEIQSMVGNTIHVMLSWTD